MPSIKLLRRQESGRGLFHLTFDAERALLASYLRPGQFLQVSAQGAKSYFAIACRPGSSQIELLVKNDGLPASILCSAPPGDVFECSAAQGGGFDLSGASDHHLHLFSMGSGIAPFRALIQLHLAGEVVCRSITLWQGAFTEEHLPFQSEYDGWTKGGVRVIPCLDGIKGPDSGNVLERLGRSGTDLSRALCLWIGSASFGEAVEQKCAEQGLKPGMLRTNF